MDEYLYAVLLMLRDGFIYALTTMINITRFCYDNILSSSVVFLVLLFVCLFIDAIICERVKDKSLASILHRLYFFFLALGAWILFFMYSYKIGSNILYNLI